MQFYTNKAAYDGLTAYCRPCHYQYCRARHSKDWANEYQRRWRAENVEKVKIWKKQSAAKNLARLAERRQTDPIYAEHIRGRARLARVKNPVPSLIRSARRRAAKVKAYSKWERALTRFVVAEAYDLTARRKSTTGIVWQVDHVVPLRGKNVSGLHVWNNFQVIPAIENQRKHNTFKG